MSGFSNSSANSVINNHLRAQVAPTIRTLYFALFVSDPSDAFTAGNEVSASWYVRKPTGAWAAPANGVTYNTTRVEFPAVTGAPVTVTHIGIIEGSTPADVTSTLLYSHQLSAPKTLNVNDVYLVETAGSSGDYTLSLV